ncbi:hypothetical protein MMC08_002672 [Hypocenomyce scalaris]|nr:hypothetical protein [Hypocenomyce scalaris]
MATVSRTIPRFLLPQLTWTTSAPRVVGLSTLPVAYTPPRPQRRTIASQSTAWQHPRRRSDIQTHPQRSLLSSRNVFPPAALYLLRLARPFHTSPTLHRDHHFDTLKFVQRLKDEGFSEEQAIAMMRVLSDVIEESIQNLTRTMVLREDAERTTYTQKVDFAKLRSELLSLDSRESDTTRSSHERLTNDLSKLNARLRDEIGRTQASVRLDLNLEKGRIREEANGQELKIKETETRIEQEVAGLRERVEGVKFSTLQWLM